MRFIARWLSSAWVLSLSFAAGGLVVQAPASTGTQGGGLPGGAKNKYRGVWDPGRTRACNLYRVTPMKPVLPGKPSEIPTLPRERLVVNVPTFVFWALDDAALLPGLLEGLEEYVPKLEIKKVPGATHWIVHEQPQYVASEIEAFLQRAQ